MPLTKDKSITDNATASHSILLKAGFIRQSGAGIYSLLPLGLRVINKIEAIIDDEMQAIGSQKVSLPMLLNPDTWKITGRWEGSKEFFRLKDRKDADLLLAPTHEEEITQLVSAELRTSKQLPIRLYQIGHKYRDEIRPRAGLLRGREFIMKDLYSFDDTKENAYHTYDEVASAYARIFNRIGVPFIVAEADSGNIGGSKSHEYHLLSNLGEDTLLSCSHCGYTANEELAVGRMDVQSTLDYLSSDIKGDGVISRVFSKDIELMNHTHPHVLSYSGLNYDETDLIKGYAVVLTPKSRQANLLKIQNKLSQYLKDKQQLSTKTTLDIQPVSSKGLNQMTADMDNIHLFIDDSLSLGQVVSTDNITVHTSQHYRLAEEGDHCALCDTGNPLNSVKSIECGHTFYLGTKYSSPLECGYRDNNKAEKIPAEMGCYGIGVSRLLAAVAEIKHDDKGIAWPIALAPYSICIVSTDDRKEEFKELSNEIYDRLNTHFRNDIVIDDRRSGFGSKMKDTELIGYPYTIIVGKKTLGEDRIVEIHERVQGGLSKKTEVSIDRIEDILV